MKRQAGSDRTTWALRAVALCSTVSFVAATSSPLRVQAEVSDLTLVGETGGAVTAITRSGPYLYAAVGPRLAVLTADAEPAIVGMSPPVPHVMSRMAAWGGYVYGASESGAVQVFDVRLPEAPVPTTAVPLQADRFSVYLLAAGSRLYASSFWCDSTIGECPDDDFLAAGWRTTTRVFDIAVPGQPVELGVVDEMYGPLVADGGFVYVLDLVRGLRVYEPGDDVLLRRVGSLDHPLPDRYVSIALDGSRRYASREGFSTYAIDVVRVSPAGAMTLESTTEMPSSFHAMAYDSGRLFAAGFEAIHVFVPDMSPTVNLIASHDLPHQSWGLAVRDEVVFVGGSHLTALDLSERDEPGTVSLFGRLSASHDIDVAPGLAATAAGPEGVRIYDTSDIRAPSLVGRDPFGGFAEQVRLREGLLYVGGGWQGGLTRYDLQDPANPVFMDVYWPAQPDARPRLKINPGRFTVGERYVYVVAERSNSMTGSLYETHSVEVVDPLAGGGPTAIGSVELAFGDLALTGHPMIELAEKGLAAASGTGLMIIDVSEPRAPRVVGTQVFSSTIRGFLAAPNGLVVAVDDGLRVLDLTDPSDPRVTGIVSSVDLGGSPKGMSAASYLGRSLIALLAGDRVAVVDLTDPTRPRIVSRSPDMPGWGYRATALAGTHVTVATERSGIHVFEAGAIDGLTVHTVMIPYAATP